MGEHEISNQQAWYSNAEPEIVFLRVDYIGLGGFLVFCFQEKVKSYYA